MDFGTSITEIKGIGEKKAGLFNKLGIFTWEDLLNYFPRAYDKFEDLCLLSDCRSGVRAAVCAVVKTKPVIMRFSGKSIVSFSAADEKGNLFSVKFFNSPFMLKAVKPGDMRVFRGIFKVFKGCPQFDQPKIYKPSDYAKLIGTIVPVYSVTKDLSNDSIAKAVSFVLGKTDFPSDYLNIGEIDRLKFCALKDAYCNIHFPKDETAQFYARKRLVFDEFAFFIHMTKKGIGDSAKIPNSHPMMEVAECKRLEESLPYELTNAQKRAISDIFKDLSGEFLMNRLVQGDVGSGKTIVAFMAMLMCAANGLQSAMMAPTEVLARQHFENIKNLASKYKLCIRPVLLTGKMGAKDRRDALNAIETGESNVVIGTHALITDNVAYKDLSLVITDEQHRFGVRQRESFKDKGLDPHILVMSATPIPRTLAMIVFSGLDISVMDEMPKNRIPISNCAVNSGFRLKAYEKIREEIKKGHQAYVICPMVSENDTSATELKSVEEHSKELAEYFGDNIRILTLNGKMKPADKSRIMEEFKEGKADILVSTTVIEVGIDVPNSTVIMIENAERFGLSQLHQLRGRVGRGDAPSFCILMSDSDNKMTQKRLKVLCETNDGFKIANEDMKLRGPGELNGVRQSGELNFGLGDIAEDSDIFMLAADIYDEIKDRIPERGRNLIDIRTI
ncbi:MAG: ATP-dependent DNA helicase RecG [Lachnospiraceae bacterium]|nr:ATP-dependent DNA helicase RecG [Lachnospiraceae bacterium]